MLASSTTRTIDAAADLRNGRRLEYLTISWNLAECVVSVAAGLLAGSTALIGFGLDSAIESASGTVLLWRLQDGSHQAAREARALRLVGVSFFLLGAWVALESLRSLWLHQAPAASHVGIAIAGLSLIVMPWLAHQKRRVATRLSSRALHCDSRQTSLCAYLSAILLGGLALNAALEWWWADSIAALAMVPIMVNEGREALRGEPCRSC